MCETCLGRSVLYKDMGFGISIEKCPDCTPTYDPCAELRKRIEQAKKEWGETHEPAS